jgi:hypothetical protein
MHVHACACMCMHVHACACMCMHVHACTRMCLHVHAYACACVHACMHAWRVPACACMCRHVHACMCVHVHECACMFMHDKHIATREKDPPSTNRIHKQMFPNLYCELPWRFDLQGQERSNREADQTETCNHQPTSTRSPPNRPCPITGRDHCSNWSRRAHKPSSPTRRRQWERTQKHLEQGPSRGKSSLRVKEAAREPF